MNSNLADNKIGEKTLKALNIYLRLEENPLKIQTFDPNYFNIFENNNNKIKMNYEIKNINKYLGTYYQEEIKALYYLKLDGNNQLYFMIKNLKVIITNIRPNNEFTFNSNKGKFDEENGRITGMEFIDIYSAPNLKFVKLNCI
jgi:hypothetical protein